MTNLDCLGAKTRRFHVVVQCCLVIEGNASSSVEIMLTYCLVFFCVHVRFCKGFLMKNCNDR